MSYGVTFQVYGHESELRKLDELLRGYSDFSTPALVHGDKQREQFNGMRGAGAGSGKMQGGMAVPQEMVSSDGKQVPILIIITSRILMDVVRLFCSCNIGTKVEIMGCYLVAVVQFCI